jgi:hypothetical protein
MIMTTADPAKLASSLTSGEKAALLSLPARDRGDMPEEAWWTYYAILDAGLSTTAGDFMMVPTPLGEAVIEHLAAAGNAAEPGS